MSKINSFFLKNIVLPLGDLIMKTNIYSSLKINYKLSNRTKEEIKDWQLNELKKILTHAYKNTVYYKKIFDQINFKPYNIQSIEELSIIPVLTKKIIRENFNDLIPTNIGNIPHIKQSTGGSSGTPLVFLLDKNSWSFTNANTIFSWEKSNFNYGQKYIALGSTSLFLNKKKSLKHLIFYKLKNKIGLNGVNMSPEVCANYFQIIKNKKIKYIYGYASSIYLLADFAIKNNIKTNIKICFPTSEILTDNYRETIQKAFNCKIIDCYGASDGGITAFSYKKGYYEVGYNTIVNQIDITNNSGKIILTDLFNYAMPLINYELGDNVLIDSEKNINYNYNGQIINKINGRVSDVLHLGNGAILTGPGFTILFKDLPVLSYRIEKINDFHIKCFVRKMDSFSSEHEEKIIETLKYQCGLDIQISIEYINQEEISANGKSLYFKVN